MSVEMFMSNLVNRVEELHGKIDMLLEAIPTHQIICIQKFADLEHEIDGIRVEQTKRRIKKQAVIRNVKWGVGVGVTICGLVITILSCFW